MHHERIREKANDSFKTEDGWSSRGYLPHFDRDGIAQFVTIRLADSVPRHVQSRLAIELIALKEKGADAQAIGRQRCRRIEALLDAGYGSCALSRDTVAEMATHELGRLVGQGHELLRWVIMPNHLPCICDTSRFL